MSDQASPRRVFEFRMVPFEERGPDGQVVQRKLDYRALLVATIRSGEFTTIELLRADQFAMAVETEKTWSIAIEPDDYSWLLARIDAATWRNATRVTADFIRYVHTLPPEAPAPGVAEEAHPSSEG